MQNLEGLKVLLVTVMDIHKIYIVQDFRVLALDMVLILASSTNLTYNIKLLVW